MKAIFVLIAVVHIGASGVAQKACFEGCWDRLENSNSPFAALEMLKDIEGCQAPDFNVETIDGEIISLTSCAGSIIVMNFWFIGCKPCIQEIPRLNDLVNEFSGQNVVFLSFARDSKEDLIMKFIPRWNLKYKIVSGEYGMSKRYCVQPYPTHIVIGKSGMVEFGSFDAVDKLANYQKLEAAIQVAVAK